MKYFAGIILLFVLAFFLLAYAKGDIALPQVDGAGVIQYLDAPKPQTIIVTAVPEQVQPTQPAPQPTVQSLVTVQPGLQPGFAEETAAAYFAPTAEPALPPTVQKLVPDYNLSPTGPYSLEEIDLCELIINAGNLDTLPLPQRGLCEQYVAMRHTNN